MRSAGKLSIALWFGALLLEIAGAPAMAGVAAPPGERPAQREAGLVAQGARFRAVSAPVQLWPPADRQPAAGPLPLLPSAPREPTPRRRSAVSRGLRAAWRRIRRRFPSPADRTLIAVDLARQTLYLLRRDRRTRRWPVSTSIHGIGQRRGSDGTPIGVFRVARKIGAGLPPGEILRDERPIGRIARPVRAGGDPRASYWITTRILRLSGLQPGWNQGGEVDTFLRHIYIHGTPNIGMLGEPASRGCIQMAPRAVIALFRRTMPGTPVLITPGRGDLAAIPGPRDEVVSRLLTPPDRSGAQDPAPRRR